MSGEWFVAYTMNRRGSKISFDGIITKNVRTIFWKYIKFNFLIN